MRITLAAASIAVAIYAAAAFACGYCVEDRIAAVYDFAVTSQAAKNNHHVAFFAIDGTLAPDDGTRRAIKTLAELADGVDKGSARVSLESTSLSVAFDPRRMSIVQIEKSLEQKLAAKKLSLTPLRVMDETGKMKEL